MADGELKLELGEELGGRLKAAAQFAGEPVGEYATKLIAAALDDDWSEEEARFAEFDRTGIAVPAAEAMARFRESLTARFAAKK